MEVEVVKRLDDAEEEDMEVMIQQVAGRRYLDPNRILPESTFNGRRKEKTNKEKRDMIDKEKEKKNPKTKYNQKKEEKHM